MIRVVLEVSEGAAPFRLAVEAEGITEALSLIAGRHPGGDVRVVFPIDPEEFFVGDGKGAETKRDESDPSQPPHELVMGGSMGRPRSPLDPSGG